MANIVTSGDWEEVCSVGLGSSLNEYLLDPFPLYQPGLTYSVNDTVRVAGACGDSECVWSATETTGTVPQEGPWQLLYCARNGKPNTCVKKFTCRESRRPVDLSQGRDKAPGRKNLPCNLPKARPSSEDLICAPLERSVSGRGCRTLFELVRVIAEGGLNNSLVMSFAPGNVTLPSTDTYWYLTLEDGRVGDLVGQGTDTIVGDSAGNFFIVIGNFDPQNAIALLKFDINGSILWQKELGFPAESPVWGQLSLTEISADLDDNLIVSGGINGKTTPYGFCGYTAKISSSGGVEWERVIGDSENYYSEFWSVTSDSVGNLIHSGTLSTGSLAELTPYYYLPRITKLDPNGDLIWEKAALVEGFSNGVVTDLANNVVFISDVYSPVEGVLIGKINSAGVLQWSRVLTGNYPYVYPGRVEVDSSGNIYALFNAYPPYIEACSVLVKFNSSGSILWQKFYTSQEHWASSSFFPIMSLKVDSLGNIYGVGGAGNTSNPGLVDLYVIRCDSDGDFVWRRQLSLSSAPMYDAPDVSINFDSQGNILIAGKYNYAEENFVIKLSTDGDFLGSYDGLVITDVAYPSFPGTMVESPTAVSLIDTFSTSIPVTSTVTVTSYSVTDLVPIE